MPEARDNLTIREFSVIFKTISSYELSMFLKSILSFCLFCLPPVFASGAAAIDERYLHFPPDLRHQAQDFEMEWNTLKAAIPVANGLRDYINTIIEADFNNKKFDFAVNFVVPASPADRTTLQTEFWIPAMTTLMTRENPFSQYFLGFFCRRNVGPLEGAHDPDVLLEASGVQLYPRANAILLEGGIADEVRRRSVQDRYDHIVHPQKFVLRFMEDLHPIPMDRANILELMRRHLAYFPGNPSIYRHTFADCGALLAEDMKRYRPSLLLRGVFTALGAMGGMAITFADALDKTLEPLSVTTTQIGNDTETDTVTYDPVPTRTVGTIQMAGLATGCMCGLFASFLVEGRLCGYRLPRTMSDGVIEAQAQIIALYLTFLHKGHLYSLPDREAREAFWRRRIPHWSRLVVNTFYEHRRRPLYLLSWALRDIPEGTWAI